MQTDDIPVASLKTGIQPVDVSVPAGTRQYLRLYFVVGTGPFTAGKLTAGLTPDQPAWKAYKSGYSV